MCLAGLGSTQVSPPCAPPFRALLSLWGLPASQPGLLAPSATTALCLGPCPIEEQLCLFRARTPANKPHRAWHVRGTKECVRERVTSYFLLAKPSRSHELTPRRGTLLLPRSGKLSASPGAPGRPRLRGVRVCVCACVKHAFLTTMITEVIGTSLIFLIKN